jgi:hypothetical protein
MSFKWAGLVFASERGRKPDRARVTLIPQVAGGLKPTLKEAGIA